MKKMYSMMNNKKGFTLIELIVVIAILGILATVAIPKISGFQDKAKIAADKTTYDTISRSISIGVADETITGDVTITSDANGKITSTVADLIEAGAALKVTNNKSHNFKWTVSGGKVTAPAIDESTGVITPAP